MLLDFVQAVFTFTFAFTFAPYACFPVAVFKKTSLFECNLPILISAQQQKFVANAVNLLLRLVAILQLLRCVHGRDK